jgi:hypothetical protein
MAGISFSMTVPCATWLDSWLVERKRMPLARSGFERKVAGRRDPWSRKTYPPSLPDHRALTS